MTSPWTCSRTASTPLRLGHFSAWIVNLRGTTKLVSPVLPLCWSGVIVHVLADGGDRPQGQDVAGVQPLEIGRHQVGFLDRQERRDDPRDLASVAGDPPERLANEVEGRVDRDRAEGPGLAGIRRGEQARVVGRLVAVPPLVADPVIVDEGVEPGGEPPDLAAVLLGVDVAAGGAAGADGVMLREKPGPLLVEEILREQGTDRAQVDHVFGQGVDDREAGKDVDLGVVTPPHHLEFAGLGDLAGEPDASGAHDAPVLVQLDGVGDVFLGVDDPLLDEAVARLAVLVAVVLQAALAGLVADGAVERVIDQEVFHDHPLMLADFRAVGHEHRPVLRRRLAGGDELGDHLDLAGLGVLRADLDLAHPAVGDDRKRGVPAVIRDVGPGELGGLDGVELLPLGEGVFLAVDEDRRHRGSFGRFGACGSAADLRSSQSTRGDRRAPAGLGRIASDALVGSAERPAAIDRWSGGDGVGP